MRISKSMLIGKMGLIARLTGLKLSLEGSYGKTEIVVLPKDYNLDPSKGEIVSYHMRSLTGLGTKSECYYQLVAIERTFYSIGDYENESR